MRLRSEAEAPWRAVRLVFSGFFIVSAGVGFLVSVPQLIGALGHAPNALPLTDVLVNLGVDAGAAGFFTWALLGDLKARDKQMARLGREESLSECQVQLANGKKLRLAQLRGSVRVVVCAGTHAQVRASTLLGEGWCGVWCWRQRCAHVRLAHCTAGPRGAGQRRAVPGRAAAQGRAGRHAAHLR